jgi:hypothetical protein
VLDQKGFSVTSHIQSISLASERSVSPAVEILEEGGSSPVLQRLHALVRKGYKPEIGTTGANDVIVLRHPGRVPDLLLHSDGMIDGLGGRVPLYKRNIEAPEPFRADSIAEELRFIKFLDSVKRPSLRDRTRRFRHRFVYVPLVIAILMGLQLAFIALITDS